MRKSPSYTSRNPLSNSKNWEENVRSVVVEACDAKEDALGYKAIFYLTYEAAAKAKKQSFEIGATFLAQRLHNLSKAGYAAPMTTKAIESIEKKIGDSLPILLGVTMKPGGAHGFA